MKTMYSTLKAGLILGLTLLWGCDKEADVTDVFEFAVTENQGANPDIINNPIGLGFTIVDRNNDNESYSMSFTSSGTGNFNYNDRTYTAGDDISLGTNPGDFSGYYTGSVPGDHKITFTVTASTTIVQQASTAINYISADFEVDLIYPKLTYTEDTPEIYVNLTDDDKMDYTLSYAISPNNGSTLLQEDTVVKQNSALKRGLNDFDFDFTTVGEYQIDFTITNHLGVQQTKTATISVLHTPILFTVGIPPIASAPDHYYKDLEYVIHFYLHGGHSLTYKVSRTLQQGNGHFNFEDNSPLEQGLVLTKTYTPTSSGLHIILFTITDDFGNSKTAEVRIEVFD